ncbi:DUF2069 domain-containing protein [Shewanella psychropiezotolerans]|uniref:DUF2069 domain-containing protein n=1 Tax=Shewanella psychropiezotolerans TaxID=2593655 RepID=A0ABX5X3R9_9GAMM|nr:MULTISPECIES: DUF2069 domain-containing protein [Shewanella]MPY24714.1 DUF2069 domain-containing protein [Shewanella sp. YLB-07]QDO83886.1 DUF2069 domain-containing protein [Shewanella psychropiezotolerans]
MNSTRLFQLCRAGYLALVLMLSAWFINKGITGEYSLVFTAMWIIPLFFPLKGIIEGKPYTYAWASYIICLYMLHGLTLIYVTEDHFLFALVEVLLLGALLIGFPFYARIRGKELGLGLKKKKT